MIFGDALASIGESADRWRKSLDKSQTAAAVQKHYQLSQYTTSPCLKLEKSPSERTFKAGGGRPKRRKLVTVNDTKFHSSNFLLIMSTSHGHRLPSRYYAATCTNVLICSLWVFFLLPC